MTDEIVLNRYRLLERLALGGTAEVWRAEDEQLGRAVAVKRLHAHLLPDAASRTRLVSEARAAARLSHPGIVGVYDVDATGEAPAIVMELVDGESLAARIERDGPLPPADAARITADVADALFHAHQQGVVHRDVKPGNVLLSADGRTRLVDFGIAHSLAESAERLTLTGTVIGTLRAMAPEQLSGGPITPRTDLYGLGVVLHEALTGRPPYPSPTPLALAEAQRAGAPDLSGVEPALAAVIASCLAHDPSRRPLHAGALAAALRAWLGGDPVPALAVGGAATSNETRVIIPPAATAGAVSRSDSEPRRSLQVDRTERPGRRVPAALLAALLAVAAVAAVAFVLNADPAPAGDAAPSTTPIPSVTLAPAWVADRVREVAEDCGRDVAAQVEAQLAALTEDEADQLVEDVRRDCEEDDGGNRNGGNRGGNGNGQGRGGGNDDD